jgi:hypothetical protein
VNEWLTIQNSHTEYSTELPVGRAVTRQGSGASLTRAGRRDESDKRQHRGGEFGFSLQSAAQKCDATNSRLQRRFYPFRARQFTKREWATILYRDEFNPDKNM